MRKTKWREGRVSTGLLPRGAPHKTPLNVAVTCVPATHSPEMDGRISGAQEFEATLGNITRPSPSKQESRHQISKAEQEDDFGETR